MKLPRNRQVIIPRRKIAEYLLSLEHRDGRNKARFFMRFGFSSDDWLSLADALRRHFARYGLWCLAKSGRVS